MAKTIYGRGFPLPPVADADRICFLVSVPNEQTHISNFVGALQLLSRWNQYITDSDHPSVDVAATWRDIVLTLQSQGCDVIQFRQPDDCNLEVSFDGGSTWAIIYNALNCAIGAANGQIADGINDGILGTGGQPGPVTPPAPSQCWNYHVKLDGNGRWLIPLPTGDGWTFTVANATGGAYDPDGGPFWACPEGTEYILGACGGALVPIGTDPIPTANHMRLIAGVGSSFVDAYNTSYTIPPGTGVVNVVFQVNDSDLSNNAGSYEFDLEVCNDTYHHIFDFSVNDGGWIIRTDFGNAQYIPGVEWRSLPLIGFAGSTVAIQFDVTFAAGQNITKMVVHWGSEGSSPASAFRGVFYDGTFHDLADGEGGVGLFTMTDDNQNQTPTTRIGVQISTNTNGKFCSVKSVELFGAGSDPF